MNPQGELQNLHLPDWWGGKIQESLTPAQGWSGCFVMKPPSAAPRLSYTNPSEVIYGYLHAYVSRITLERGCPVHPPCPLTTLPRWGILEIVFKTSGYQGVSPHPCHGGRRLSTDGTGKFYLDFQLVQGGSGAPTSPPHSPSPISPPGGNIQGTMPQVSGVLGPFPT